MVSVPRSRNPKTIPYDCTIWAVGWGRQTAKTKGSVRLKVLACKYQKYKHFLKDWLEG